MALGPNDPHLRYALFTLHGEKCYICRTPVDLKTMEVEHIVPESLLNDSDELRKVLQSLGRSQSFHVNSVENWLPACPSCNKRKAAAPFEPSLLVQLALQDAAAKGAKVQELAANAIRDRQIQNALNVLERAKTDGLLNEATKAQLKPLLDFHTAHRDPLLGDTPTKLTPFEEIGERGGIRLARGPYGIGARPAGPNVHSSFDCPNCGTAGAWNGARCVVCGMMNDD